jgi:hypothetical protein
MISGTFRQGGREFDGATLFRLSAFALPRSVFCPNGHEMTLQLPEPKPEVEGGRQLFRFVCREDGCQFAGLVYDLQLPTVTLEAVQDREGA